MDRLLIRLIRSSLGRGLAGDHWAWLLLGASFYLVRRARRDRGGVVVSMPIAAGQRYLVTLSDPQGAAGDPPAG